MGPTQEGAGGSRLPAPLPADLVADAARAVEEIDADELERHAERLRLARRVAQHFEDTDAPLGKVAQAVLAGAAARAETGPVAELVRAARAVLCSLDDEGLDTGLEADRLDRALEPFEEVES